MMKLIKLLFPVFTVCLLLTSCSKSSSTSSNEDSVNNASLVGSWKLVESSSSYFIVTFKSNGSGSSIESYGTSQDAIDFTYTYNANTGKLVLKFNDEGNAVIENYTVDIDDYAKNVMFAGSSKQIALITSKEYTKTN